MNSIDDIKKEFKNYPIERINDLQEKYKNDLRKGVKNIISLYKIKQNNYFKELLRIENLKKYEKKLKQQGANFIAGIDEVGRGSLAGPVVTSAVVLPDDCILLDINDSKKLSEKKREQLFEQILNIAIEIKTSMYTNIEIDNLNILKATILSMEKCINSFQTKLDYIIIDALNLKNIKINQISLIKADAKSISVAAASIIAKVTRDKLMLNYHKIYPEYGFDKNKGYGTKEHILAIKKYGPCPIHRKSFLKNFI